ncbi:nitroreductase/quinone reductase family protein [Mycobacterium riyadhense]|nr:nitroreductase/quinone reductase family protein [Mycobacterium riyadhense]
MRHVMKRYQQAGAFPRLIRRTAGTRPMAWLYGHIQEPLDRFVCRLSSGRTTLTSLLGDVDTTILTTTGAKSGLPRTHVVLGMPDGERVIVVASNYGRGRHPAWYYNLIANPRASIEIDGVTRDVVAQRLTGEERERYYQRSVDIYPGFDLYRRRANREIQVLALDPVEL